MKPLLCALLALSLCLGLGACQEQPKPAPSSSSSEAEATPTPTPAPTPTPEPASSIFIPAPDLISLDPETQTKIYQEPDSFEAQFSQNPIDKQYDEDYSRASSFSMILMACDDAARRWKTMTESAYQACLTVLEQAEQAALREQQAQRQLDLEAAVQVLRQGDDGTNESKVSIARQTVLLYRDWAKALCETYFNAAGKLPEFPDSEIAG